MTVQTLTIHSWQLYNTMGGITKIQNLQESKKYIATNLSALNSRKRTRNRNRIFSKLFGRKNVKTEYDYIMTKAQKKALNGADAPYHET